MPPEEKSPEVPSAKQIAASKSARYLDPGPCPEGFITVRVTNRVPLPFVIKRREGEFIFQPDAHLPFEIAQAMMKGAPELYVRPIDKPDMKTYRYTEEFETKRLMDVVKRLSRAAQMKLYKMAKELAAEEAGSEK